MEALIYSEVRSISLWRSMRKFKQGMKQNLGKLTSNAGEHGTSTTKEPFFVRMKQATKFKSLNPHRCLNLWLCLWLCIVQLVALTASPAGELTVFDTSVRINELLERLEAKLVAPVKHLGEVRACFLLVWVRLPCHRCLCQCWCCWCHFKEYLALTAFWLFIVVDHALFMLVLGSHVDKPPELGVQSNDGFTRLHMWKTRQIFCFVWHVTCPTGALRSRDDFAP